MFILSFSISFVCLVVTLLILCIIPLWDSATAHYLPVKSSILPLRKMPVFQGVAPQQFLLHPTSSLFGTQQQVTQPRQRAHTFLSGRIMFFQAYCCLGSLWFGTHPYYSLNPCVHLYYLWAISRARKAAFQNILFYVQSISIAKDRRFAEKCSPRLWCSQPSKVFFG